MPDETRLTCRYRTLRYMPNLLRDEWVNVGILLEQIESEGRSQRRRAVRLIEENSEYARVRRIHPALDEEMLRSLRVEFDKKLLASEADAAAYLAKLDQTLSNVLQFGPERAVFTDDFDIELDRLYREQVAPPVRRRQGILQSGVDWIRTRLVDVFRRHRVLNRLDKNVSVAEFTYPGDRMTLDYAYQNGVRGFVQAVSPNRDMARARSLAFTAERVRRRLPAAEFTAVTESELVRGNPDHEFVSQLFADQRIEIIPLSRAETFADTLRVRLQ
jgi:hypothetical protein